MRSKLMVPRMRMSVPRMQTGGCIVSVWRQRCALVCQGYVLVRAKSAFGARDAYCCAGDAYGVPLVHELLALGARDANWYYIVTSLY